jgi:hypothetical protein
LADHVIAGANERRAWNVPHSETERRQNQTEHGSLAIMPERWFCSPLEPLPA